MVGLLWLWALASARAEREKREGAREQLGRGCTLGQLRPGWEREGEELGRQRWLDQAEREKEVNEVSPFLFSEMLLSI
jgi:hypothetical protein